MDKDQGEGCLDDKDTSPFVKVEDPSVLIPILERRLPNSAMICNSVKLYGSLKGKAKVSFYTLNGDIDDSSWIFYLHYREDWGQDYQISVDESKSKISRQEAIEILSATKLINWEKPFFFITVKEWLASILMEIAAYRKGKVTEIHPVSVYYREPEKCMRLEPKIPESLPSVQLRPLDSDLGTQFILDTWKYASQDSDIVIRRSIENCASGGVYVDGKPVCGVITQGFGMLSALYTLKEHRGKGYAKAVMHFVSKELAKQGMMIPVSTVELDNIASIAFHEKLGWLFSHRGYYVFHSKQEY